MLKQELSFTIYRTPPATGGKIDHTFKALSFDAVLTHLEALVNEEASIPDGVHPGSDYWVVAPGGVTSKVHVFVEWEPHAHARVEG